LRGADDLLKTTKIIAGSLVLLLAALSAHAQGTFQNLDFESANPMYIPNDNPYVTAASAFPDWAVTIGGAQQTQVTYNAPSTGATWVSLVGQGFGAIDGNYSALLQGGVTASDASLSQAGLIPASAQSLLFEANGVGPLEVLIGGQSVPYSAVGSGPNYTLYSANISAWAGDTEQLTFSALEGGGGSYYWHLDDISFSPTATPEPNTLALIVMGGAAFAVRQWRKRG